MFLQSTVLLKTSFVGISFPTDLMTVTSYISEMMREEVPDVLKKYALENFDMRV